MESWFPSLLLRDIACAEVKSAQISATTDRTPRSSSFFKINFMHSEIDNLLEFSIIEQIKDQLIYLFKCIYLHSSLLFYINDITWQRHTTLLQIYIS